ncbi:TetR/AcrR family transcriptional regulator [Oceanicaulis sp.]|uniref:TetR/AcrR family transcriptional regulator n=1 Tax=Oceanicaulis sp. TaxID=1924941 RepID=UPI003BA9732E
MSAPKHPSTARPARKHGASRTRLISAAAQLFQEKGFAATGLSEILDRAQMPKGSLYHHFPGGKAELGVAAMESAGQVLHQTLTARQESQGTSAEAIRAFAQDLAGWLESSAYTRGCPIATVALEQANGAPELVAAIRSAFDRVIQGLAEQLVAEGQTRERARQLATLCLSTLEGALILARSQHSSDPVRMAGEELARLLSNEASA